MPIGDEAGEVADFCDDIGAGSVDFGLVHDEEDLFAVVEDFSSEVGFFFVGFGEDAVLGEACGGDERKVYQVIVQKVPGGCAYEGAVGAVEVAADEDELVFGELADDVGDEE